MHLNFDAGKNLLEEYSINVVKSAVVYNENQAKKEADKIGFPCILKFNSPVHKTDIGGVIKDIENYNQLSEAFSELQKKARKIDSDGFVLQRQLKGKEIIIGGKQDPQFGPVVLFGLGGVFVEVMKDISLKIAPVTKEEAENMIRSVKGYPILKGTRGEKQVALEKIADAIISVSKLMNDHPEIKELDLNPLIVSDKYCKAVDLRIIC